MDDLTLPLPGLSPVAGRPVKACFDGGSLSSDAGVLVLREVEGRLGVAERLARCLDDPRDPALITHSLADMIRFRMLMIAAGYEDGNDATSLRQDPVFKMAQGIAPSGRPLASQPTISRLENMADVRALLRMAGAMVDLYCASFRQVPKRIVLDVDDTFDAVHGGQQLRLFNAHHDEYGFQPIVVFDGEGRFVAAVLRPAKRPKGVEIRGHLRRLVRAIRAHWPRVEILVRADGHYGVPEVIDLCRAMDVRFILGAPTSTRLRQHVVGLEARVADRYAAKPGTDKVRRFTDFYDGAASWSRTERIIARMETGDQGTDTRFIVTDLAGRSKAAAAGKALEIWFQDEARVGQKGTLAYVWARCGTRPRAVQDTRYGWAYLFGAVCPERAVGAGLVMPHANTEAMTLHLAEIGKAVSPGAHAALVVDGAGWHVSDKLVVPDNITLVKLPPYAPELNPIENVWAYLRGTKLAHRLLNSYDDIVTACCDAWNSFVADQKTVRSITTRQWATCQNI